MIPKLPENLASGGYLSVLTSKGNLLALESFRPASSFKESGTLILNLFLQEMDLQNKLRK